MLHKLRAMVRSWFAKLLIALLVLSFAAWGIGDVFVARGSNVVATVGDREISTTEFANAFRAYLNRFSASGQEVSVAEGVEFGFDRRVLDELSAQAAVDLAGEQLELSAPDSAVSDRIRRLSGFQDAAGRFDSNRYARLLSQSGLSQKEYEVIVRRDIARLELLRAISEGIVVPAGPFQLIFAHDSESRRITYFEIGQAQVDSPAPPTETEIITYFEENQDRFQHPERRDFTFLWLSPEELAVPSSIAEGDALDYYHFNSGLYGTPAYRTINQIVFETEAEAKAAHGRLLAGTHLIDIGRELSIGVDDISLGRVTRDELSEELANAAFALSEPGFAGPVQTPFGWAVQEIVAITDPAQTEFEEVRTTIIDVLAREAALDRIPELASSVEDLRAAGMSLEEVAQQLELQLHSHAGLNRQGIGLDGIAVVQLPTDAEFLADAFESHVDEDLNVVDLQDGGAFVLRVDKIDESRPKSLDDVRNDIVEILTEEASREAILLVADRLKARIEAGERLEKIATEVGVETVATDPFPRTYPDPALSFALGQTVFQLDSGEPAAGSSRIPGNAIVLRLDEILPADPNPVSERVEATRPFLEDAVGGVLAELFTQKLLENYGVSTNQSSVEAALGLLSGS